MKKFIAFASAAAFLVSAVPALAFGGFHFSSSDLDIDVDVDNDATVKNYVDTNAKTGHNDSVGGNASNKVKSNSSHSYHHWFGGSNSVDNTEANGGDAGEITTGDADAYSDVVNVVNTNVVRVRR